MRLALAGPVLVLLLAGCDIGLGGALRAEPGDPCELGPVVEQSMGVSFGPADRGRFLLDSTGVAEEVRLSCEATTTAEPAVSFSASFLPLTALELPEVMQSRRDLKATIESPRHREFMGMTDLVLPDSGVSAIAIPADEFQRASLTVECQTSTSLWSAAVYSADPRAVAALDAVVEEIGCGPVSEEFGG